MILSLLGDGNFCIIYYLAVHTFLVNPQHPFTSPFWTACKPAEDKELSVEVVRNSCKSFGCVCGVSQIQILLLFLHFFLLMWFEAFQFSANSSVTLSNISANYILTKFIFQIPKFKKVFNFHVPSLFAAETVNWAITKIQSWNFFLKFFWIFFLQDCFGIILSYIWARFLLKFEKCIWWRAKVGQ